MPLVQRWEGFGQTSETNKRTQKCSVSVFVTRLACTDLKTEPFAQSNLIITEPCLKTWTSNRPEPASPGLVYVRINTCDCTNSWTEAHYHHSNFHVCWIYAPACMRVHSNIFRMQFQWWSAMFVLGLITFTEHSVLQVRHHSNTGVLQKQPKNIHAYTHKYMQNMCTLELKWSKWLYLFCL